MESENSRIIRNLAIMCQLINSFMMLKVNRSKGFKKICAYFINTCFGFTNNSIFTLSIQIAGTI